MAFKLEITLKQLVYTKVICMLRPIVEQSEHIALMVILLNLISEATGLIFLLSLYQAGISIGDILELKTAIPDICLWFSSFLSLYLVLSLLEVQLRKGICILLFISLSFLIMSRFCLSVVALLRYPRVSPIGDLWWYPSILVPVHLASVTIISIVFFLNSFLYAYIKGNYKVSIIVLKLRELAHLMVEYSIRYRYPLIFFYAFMIRFSPELRIWPHFVGYDTVEYAAALRDLPFYNWHPFSETWWYGTWARLPPLLYMILYPFVRMGIDPNLIFKVVPSVVYSFLAVSSLYYMERGLMMPKGKAILATLLATSYYVSLGASWQLHRNVLGYALLLLSLVYIEHIIRYGPKYGSVFLLTIFSILSYLAHQMSLGILLVMYSLLLITRRDRRETILFLSLIIVGLVFLAWYAGWTGRKRVTLATAGMGGVRRALNAFSITIRSFVAYHYPLMFIALFGYKRRTSLSLLTYILLFLSLFPGICSKVGPNIDVAWRAQIMLVIPLSIYAVEALVDKVNRKLAITIFLLYILLGWHYSLSKSPSLIISYLFSGAFSLPSHMPSSILPIDQQEPLIKIGHWLSSRANRQYPAYIMGANLYVFVHLGAGYNPNISWILRLTDLKHKLYAQAEGIYLVIREGWIPENILSNYTSMMFKIPPYVVLFANRSSALALSKYIILR